MKHEDRERDIVKRSKGKLNGKLNEQQEVHGKKDSWVEVSVLSFYLLLYYFSTVHCTVNISSPNHKIETIVRPFYLYCILVKLA
jgi:hypothetical protein